MRIAMLLALLSLGLTGCEKTIHEANAVLPRTMPTAHPRAVAGSASAGAGVSGPLAATADTAAALSGFVGGC